MGVSVVHIDMSLNAVAGVVLNSSQSGVVQSDLTVHIAAIHIPVEGVGLGAVNLFLQVGLEGSGSGVAVVSSSGIELVEHHGALRIAIDPGEAGVAIAILVSSQGQALVDGAEREGADDDVLAGDHDPAFVLGVGDGDMTAEPIEVQGVGDLDQVLGDGADDDVGLQGVQHHLSGFLTSDGLVGIIVSGEAVQQAMILGIAQDVGLPVGANIALSSGIEAQDAEQHLGSLNAGHLAVGVKGGGVAASNDTGLGAVSDVAGSPVVLGISEGAGAGIQVADVVTSVGENSDHLRHLGTLDGVGGTERAIGITVQDTDGGQDIDGFSIADLIIVRIVVGVLGADHGDEAEQSSNDQDQSQNFAKVLHESSSF